MSASRLLSPSPLLLLFLSVLLSACGGEQSAPPEQLELQARNLLPENAGLSEIYQRSCQSCHTVAATGAPLTGDHIDWKKRMEKGMEQLLTSVVNGAGGMPPFGLCMECEPEQFEQLIWFMAAAPSQNPN